MNILLIGTMYDQKHPTITGQTVISSIIIENLQKSYILNFVNTADNGKYQRGTFKFAIYRICHFLIIYIKIISTLLTKSIDVVYYQPATSKLGVARDYIAIRIIKSFKKTIVLHLLGYMTLDTIKEYGSRTWKWFNYVYDNATNIIVEGEKMKLEFLNFKFSDSKILIVPNGMNVKNASQLKAKEYVPKDVFHILYLSNFIFSKGYYDVIQAIDILRNSRGLKVDCIFAGKFYNTLEGCDSNLELGTKEVFDRFIGEHHLNDYVNYYTGLYDTQKHEAFCKANVFILPTYYSAEGQPMSILEAMAYGCVPIVTAHGHIPMMVNDENGCVILPKNPKSIADAVERLIKNPDIYNKKSSKSISDFKDKFSGDTFSNAVKRILENSIK